MNLKKLHNDIHEGALQLMAEHRVLLFARAKSICGNDIDADELVVRTIDQAIRKIDTYSGEGDILSWMMSILVNLHNNDHRNPVVRGTTAVEADELERYAGADWSTDEQLLRNSDSKAIREAIAGIDPKYNQMLLMRYYDEFSLKQIAAVLQLPLGTVSRRMQVAHRIISGKLAAEFSKAKPKLALLGAFLLAGSLFGAVAWGVVEALTAPESPSPRGTVALGLSDSPAEEAPGAGNSTAEAAVAVPTESSAVTIQPSSPAPAAEQISTTENNNTEKEENMKSITKAAARLAVGAALVIGAVSPARAAWRYVAAEDPDNAYDGVAYITDGNWAIKVSAWNATNFTTPMGGGWLAGEGVMDLTTVNTDLGKTWSFQGAWNGDYKGPFYNFSTLTEIILPEECTSICDGMFNRCSNLTKLTLLSGRVTYVGHFAFYGCSSLAAVSPEFVLSGECSEYGKQCFCDCRAMHIPMKWKLEGGISLWHQAFWNTGITSWDVSEVMGSVTGYNGLGNNSVTNSVWGPNMTTFIKFGSEKIIRFTGGVPTTAFDNNRSYRIYGDPAMDANWRSATVVGVDFAKPTAEQRAAVAEAFGAADAANLIGVSSKNVYLIKWISPYRKVGMKLIFK